MNTQELLTLFDREQRRDIVYPNVRREVTPTVIRHVSLTREQGFVIYSTLDADSVDDAIREQVAHFEGIGQDFEWKVYDHDQPPDLKERLAAVGFEIEEPEALLVLDLDETPPGLFTPMAADIHRVVDPARIADVRTVEEAVWQKDFSDLVERLARDLRDDPDQIGVYVAYIDEQPVSAAWIYFHAGSQFASLWGGSTLPAYRKRGLYRSLIAVRGQEARARGVRFLTVDASPMSQPILARHGFQLLTYSTPCVWHVHDKANDI